MASKDLQLEEGEYCLSDDSLEFAQSGQPQYDPDTQHLEEFLDREVKDFQEMTLDERRMTWERWETDRPQPLQLDRHQMYPERVQPWGRNLVDWDPIDGTINPSILHPTKENPVEHTLQTGNPPPEETPDRPAATSVDARGEADATQPGWSFDSQEEIGQPGDLSETRTNRNTDSGYASAATNKLPHARSVGDVRSLAEAASSTSQVRGLDDGETVYSDASTVPLLTKEAYLSELADALFNQVCSESKDGSGLERACMILPQLLKAFALKLGFHAPSQMHTDVMFFIYKNKSDIVERFKKRCSQEEHNELDTQVPDSEKMSLDQIMTLWDQKLEQPEDQVLPHAANDIYPGTDLGGRRDSAIKDSDDSDDSDGHDKTNAPHLLAYRNFIFKCPEFKWLVETLRRELCLSPAEANSMEAIREEIMRSLPSSHKVSKRKFTDYYGVTFVIVWNPLEFLKDQKYEEEPYSALAKVITLTGSERNAQALTCEDYSSQTWPATGKYVLEMIKRALYAYTYKTTRLPQDQHIPTLPDRTRVKAAFTQSGLKVETLGTAYSIAEIGEQLAWLGASIRSSEIVDGMTYCTPFVKHILPPPGPWKNVDFICQLDCSTEPAEGEPKNPNGQCWYNLFRNPVVAKGFPIPKRSDPDTGLEIPFNMMAGLADAWQVNTFDGKVFIKGFSTMLVPTKRQDTLLVWHLIYNQSGDRISYLDSTTSHADNITVFELKHARHILGWCDEAQLHIGAPDASYAVERSGLPRPQKRSILNNVSIHAGSIITADNSFIIGPKDTPAHISRHTRYISKLRWISKKFVLLWDEEEKRGWLVNGASALLHVLRASLEFDRTGDFKSVFLLDPDNIEGVSKDPVASSAIEVLLNTGNRRLKLYPDGRDCLYLEDRVESIYNVLELIIDYQVGVVERGDLRPRTQLEGWDFKDVATEQDPFHLRLAALKESHTCWINFTRDIHAATLFGRGFGEIIRPAGYQALLSCGPSELPKEKYYLAACIEDLNRIMDMYGDKRASPPVLSESTIWYNPYNWLRDSDPVQVILPATFAADTRQYNRNFWGDRGAVIFGHNSNFDLGLNVQVSPDEEQFPLEGSDTHFYDSGIGNSQNLSSIASNGNTPSASPQALLVGDYKVGLVCALHKELKAVRALFDETHSAPDIPSQDTNHYSFGRVGEHNIVAACLPSGAYGTNSAADVVSHMVRSFPVRFCLLVGIGGGVPSPRNDIRLGDIVVSQTGAIQYDLGRVVQEGAFEATGCLQRPPRFLTTAIASLEADPDHSPSKLRSYIDEIAKGRPGYGHPGQKKDVLFTADYVHNSAHDVCDRCNGPRVDRKRRRSNNPLVHYGLIASGNQVMRDAQVRDRLASEKNFLCFEMEAAGVMDTVPCLVIRGICDYADSHKNKVWQEYASAAAAAYAKLLLSVVRNPNDSERLSLNVPPAKRGPTSWNGNQSSASKRARTS